MSKEKISFYVSLILSSVFLITACASIPKESIELSVTVGRDISAMQKAHLELLDVFYNRLISDVNRFIDEVYVPYQTDRIMDEFGNELLKENSKGEKEIDLEKTKIILEELHYEIEDYRNSKLKPLLHQRDSIKQNLIDAYNRIIYANSIVTAHLASVLKVNDVQNEILLKMNLGNLQQNISTKLSTFSEAVSKLTEKIKSKKENTEKIIEQFDKLFGDIIK